MKHFLDLRAWVLIFAVLTCQSALAKFLPINGGMVNQATVVATAAGTTTAVATSNQVYIFEGATTQNFKMPDATKLPIDWWYRVINNSTGAVTVKDGAGGTVATVAPTRDAYFQMKARANAAGTWKSKVLASGDELDANYFLSSYILANYYKKSDFASTGPAVSSPVLTGVGGLIDASLLPATFSGTCVTCWSILGNNGLNAAVNFLGTTDATDLIFKTNATERFRITSAGALTTQLATGLVKSTAGVLGLGTSGTDYAPATSGSAIQKGNGAGGFSSAVAGTDYIGPTVGSAIQKGDGAGQLSAATANVDYQAPISFAALGSSPNSAGASVSAATITLQPASASQPGLLSTGTQGIGGDKNFTGSVISTKASAASAPAISIQGDPVTGGSTTTNKPHVSVENASTSNNWSTSGTQLGMNVKTGFTGNIFDFQLNAANVYRANYEGGLTLWNTNDNGNYLGSLTLCNGASSPASSASCVSLYQAGGSVFKIYSPNATQGASNMESFNNATGEVGIGQSAATMSAALGVQILNFAAYNAYTTIIAKGKTSQSGDLQQWMDSSGNVLAKVDISGNASVQKLKVAKAIGTGSYATPGGTLVNDGTNFTGSTVNVPACSALTAGASTSVDWSLSNCFTVLLNANTTFSFSNRVAGQTVIMRITNPASYTWTMPSTNVQGASVLWSGSTIPTASTGNKKDIITIFFDGTEMYGNAVSGFGGF